MEEHLGQESKKKKNTYTYIGIAVAVAVAIITFQLLSKPPSFAEMLKQVATGLNKTCPMMVDQETRLDNVTALQDNELQYNYTLVDREKADLDVEHIKELMNPSIIKTIKTNPGLQILRDNKISFSYSYKDKNGVLLFKQRFTPEDYNK